MPGLLDAPIHPGGRVIGGVLEVDGEAGKVGIGRAQLAFEGCDRLGQRVDGRGLGAAVRGSGPRRLPPFLWLLDEKAGLI